MTMLHDWLPDVELCYLVVSAYIPNYIVDFTIITKLVKLIYWIVYEFFWMAYPARIIDSPRVSWMVVWLLNDRVGSGSTYVERLI
jgi:hypothetical protein